LSHFKEKFRRQMLTTPRAYINQQKIELAKELLLQRGSITEVAEELSFDTPAYFSTVFRKFTAMTPSQYIRAHVDRL
ncbi:MAG: helix-turn-helix transcriptional regulator, partial [Clostridia bacterium]|nr:helix-turn-helix transcriptional regulator [Clostridia bacterium]